MIQMPPNSHQHGGVYPLSNPQVPIPYGQVPYLPANFNPVPGNFVYGQAVIYQVKNITAFNCSCNNINLI
jgi:hypothetical protein